MTAPTSLTVHQLGDAALTDPTDVAADATNGNVFANSGATVLRVNNTAGATATVDFSPADSLAGAGDEFAVTAERKTIPASTIQWFGRRTLADFGRNCVVKGSATTVKFTVLEP